MDVKHRFEETYQAIGKKEIIIMSDVHQFPAYDQDIVSPNMLVCISHAGMARVLYDTQEVTFKPNEIAVVMPGHILRPLESSPDYNVTIIMHSAALCEELKTKRLTHDQYKFHCSPSCPVTEEEMAQFMKAVDLLEHICKASLQYYPLRHEMLIAQTNVMTEMLNAYRRTMDEKEVGENHKYSVFNDFCDLLATHHREQHEVGFYANKLHLSTRYFSIIIKEISGLSASDYLEEYIATQAKNILATRPDLSVQQVGYLLGFAEAPSFCRFFKRLTGLRPKQLRNL